MQRYDLASEHGIGIDVEWCSDCGKLLKWHTQLTHKEWIDLRKDNP